ncbi:MAG: nucleoside triphosphate pyrophosphohydrolase [Bacteroidales bacterium]|nr:nucleoside triphosphate pyrophosphohydrolase [Bacteroidales bacterium]
MDPKLEAFERLLNIMDELREQCPWDRKQTFETLRHLTIEETFELSEAVLDKDPEAVKKELGDLMLHLVFYSRIAEESGLFSIRDVLEFINAKLIRRHPHIYGDVEAPDARTVADNWEKIKMKEGRKSALDGVPKSLPPLVKAYRIQEKASGIGFDWEHAGQVWEKVREELDELYSEASEGSDTEKLELEFGDVLFALVNYARFIGVNPEDALEKTNRKFIRRFRHLEEQARLQGKSLGKMTLEEMDVFWEEAKKKE